MTNILDENNFDKEFSILKIDAESWDPKVIEGLDFNKYKPQIIVTEDYYWEPENLDKKFYMLEKNGYVLLGLLNYNSIWIKMSPEIYNSKLTINFFQDKQLLNVKYKAIYNKNNPTDIYFSL